MTGVGGRFDLEAARREAQEAKRRARVRAIASNVTLCAVLLALAIGGKIGWDKWQTHREAEERAAEEARAAQAHAEAERKREEAERRAKAEAERRAKEAAREAERRAKEAAREAERKAREEEKIRAEERRREEEARRIEQEELRRSEESSLQNLRFSAYDRLCLAYGLEDVVEASVAESRWASLASHVEARRTIDFLEMIRGGVTNEFSESSYPDRATFARILSNLDSERFTMVVKLKNVPPGRRLVLAAGDVERGLAVPAGARAIGKESRPSGWTVPFTFGSNDVFFVMDQSVADRFVREWSARRRRLRSDAEKLSNRDEYVAARLAKELPDFIRSLKVEVEMPPPEPEKGDPSKAASAKGAGKDKDRPNAKGSGSGFRGLSGPRRYR